jgi:hypothetical protein
MLKVDRQARTLRRLENRAITEAGFRERDDLQRMIRSSPDAFFQEMGEKLLLIGEEIRPTDVVDDRVDLLAIDQNGAVVIMELKRSSHKLQLLQALSYAAMIGNWDRSRLISTRAQFSGKPKGDAESEVEEFLLEGIGDLNQQQRVILLAENFEYEVLVTAEWLSERYDVDIRCYRFNLSVDDGAEYLVCTSVYPPPELTQVAVRRGARPESAPRKTWGDWESALAEVENPAMVEFFRAELAAGQQSALGRRRLVYKVPGGQFGVSARRQHAYVWQQHRFRDDIAYWMEKLGPQSKAEPVDGGRSVRFFLASPEDFARFREALRVDAPQWEILDARGTELADDGG